MHKKIFFNSITISLPKNVIQFLLGIILYWLITGIPDTYVTLTALAGFLITYSAVYLYNDVIDYREDMLDKEKRKWKLVAGGGLTVGSAKLLTILCVVAGLSISFLVSRWFFIIMMGMLFFNLLHSSPYTKFKKKLYKTTFNMTIIEYLKYSSGWFALTSNISMFPFWLILAFSIVYTTSYIIYKFKFRGKIIKTNKKLFWGLGIVGGVSYLISFIHYGFPISMTFLIVFPLIVLLVLKFMRVEVHRISNMIIIEYLILPVVIISFVILTVPMVGTANENMAREIDVYTESFTENMPEDVITPIRNISDEIEKYETLEDIEKGINESLSNITDQLLT